MIDWQPIPATPDLTQAPFDGKPVLVWQPQIRQEKPWIYQDEVACVAYYHKTYGWSICHVGGYEWDCDLEAKGPTHWAPINRPLV